MFQLASPGQKNTKTPCFEVALMSFQATTDALPRPVFCLSGLIRILMVQFEHWASAFPWLSPFFSCQAECHLIRRLWAQVLKWQSRKWEKAIPIGEIRRMPVCFVCRRMELHPTLVSQINPSGLRMQMQVLDTHERLWTPGENVPQKQARYSAGESSGEDSECFFFFGCFFANGIVYVHVDWQLVRQQDNQSTQSHLKPYLSSWKTIWVAVEKKEAFGAFGHEAVEWSEDGNVCRWKNTNDQHKGKSGFSQWLWWGANFQCLCSF